MDDLPIVQYYDVQTDKFTNLTQEKFDELNNIAIRNGMIVGIIRRLVAYEEEVRSKNVPPEKDQRAKLYQIFNLAKRLNLAYIEGDLNVIS